MDPFPSTPEVIGIGFLAVLCLSIIYKIITMLVGVIQDNARAMEKIAKSTDINTEATKTSAETVKSTVEVLKNSNNHYIQILLEVMKSSFPTKK